MDANVTSQQESLPSDPDSVMQRRAPPHCIQKLRAEEHVWAACAMGLPAQLAT